MKKFLITKTVTTELELECNSEHEARAWADKIVVTLEDTDGRPVELPANMEFTAFSSPSQCLIELLS